MKHSIKIVVLFIVFLGLFIFTTSHTGMVFASRNTPITALTPTPTPMIIEATATVDPASIGDTSGVIAIGIIVVFIVLAGVGWGSFELRQESLKNRKTKE